MAVKNKNHKYELSDAIKWFWQTRKLQNKKQKTSGRSDQGTRSEVTGGAQMDGFCRLLTNLIMLTGIEKSAIYYKQALELPGYFRPEKRWDILVIKNEQLLVAIEAKSQVGPSFGNNFNNRAEEAIGSAIDLWTAYREGIFNKTVKPWVGYIFLLEDCPKSNSQVSVKEPHFEVFPEFKNASYCRRYEILCRKLLRERHYCASCFITSKQIDGLNGKYLEPAEDLSFKIFAKSLTSHIKTYL
jgi:hypothetical protein